MSRNRTWDTGRLIRLTVLLAGLLTVLLIVLGVHAGHWKQEAVRTVEEVCTDISSGQINDAEKKLSEDVRDGIGLSDMDTDAYMKVLAQALGYGEKDSTGSWQDLVREEISDENMRSLQHIHDDLQKGLLSEYTVDQRPEASWQGIITVKVHVKGTLVLSKASFTKAAEKASDRILQYVDEDLPDVITSYETDPDALKEDLRNRALDVILPEMEKAVREEEPSEETWVFRVDTKEVPKILSITVS